MQHALLFSLSLLAATVDAKPVVPPICSTLSSCYARFTQSSAAAAYCTSFMKVVPTTTRVTVTHTAPASTSIVTKIVTVKGTTTTLRTTTVEAGEAYKTVYQPCTGAQAPPTGTTRVVSPAKRAATKVAASPSLTAPGCIQYLVADGAAAVSSACNCIVVTPTSTVSITQTITPKPFTYTWTGTVNLRTTVTNVKTLTVKPTYTVTMDPLPCSLSTTSPTATTVTTPVAPPTSTTTTTPVAPPPSTTTTTPVAPPPTTTPTTPVAPPPTTTPTSPAPPPPTTTPILPPSSVSAPASSFSGPASSNPQYTPKPKIVDPSFEQIPAQLLYQPGTPSPRNWNLIDNAYFAASSPGSGAANFTTYWGNQFVILGNNVDPPGTNGGSGSLYYNAVRHLHPQQEYTVAYEQAIHFSQPATGESCLVGLAFIGLYSGARTVINEQPLTPGTAVYTGFEPVAYTFTPNEPAGQLQWYTYCNGNDYSQRFFVAIDMVSFLSGRAVVA